MIRLARTEDLEQIDPIWPGMKDQALDALKGENSVVFAPMTFTVFHGERPVACAGLVPLWEGVASAWACIDQSAKSRAVLRTIIRDGREARDWLLRDWGIRRIQGDAPVGSEATVGRLLEAVGFEREALLHNWGQGGLHDSWIYAIWVRDN